jgi:hypothetical protein
MTHKLREADEIYKEVSEQHPDFDHSLVMEWREKMEKSFVRRMLAERYGHHLDRELYEEATSYFVNPDGTHGPHWSVETIKAKSGLDFDSKKFNCWDFAYICNMFYSDFSNIFSDATYYLKMAKAYLTDGDYFGDPSERAYHNALKRINYFE